MYHLVYLSSATAPMSEENLRDLLFESRRHNSKHAITGLLLYSDGQILQVLEGDREKVLGLYSKVQRDSRHAGIYKLADGAISHRSFSEWSMGFRSVAPQVFARLLGYRDTSTESYLSAYSGPDDHSMLAVLRSFVCDPGEVRL